MNIVDKLEQSLDDLETAINSAKVRINKVPELAPRVASYEEMLAKQRLLTQELRVEVSNPETASASNITRLVNLINGISAMIKDDALEVLNELNRKAAQ
jgi:hypothetical protein